MRCADRAWLALAAGVLAYEAAAPRGELLSQGVDRYRQRRPVTTTLAVGYIAGHLLRIVPARFDPLTRLAEVLGR